MAYERVKPTYYYYYYYYYHHHYQPHPNDLGQQDSEDDIMTYKQKVTAK